MGYDITSVINNIDRGFHFTGYLCDNFSGVVDKVLSAYVDILRDSARQKLSKTMLLSSDARTAFEHYISYLVTFG